MNNGKWGWPAVTAALALLGVSAAWATYLRGERIGREAAITEAAVDRERLMNVTAAARALSDRMGERVVVDGVQNTRLDVLERQHHESMEAMRDLSREVRSLVNIMWKDEKRREARQ